MTFYNGIKKFIGYSLLIASSAMILAAYSYFTPYNRGDVSHNVIRARQPTISSLEKLLYNDNIRSILNLRGENTGKEWYDNEFRFVQENNLDLLSVGLSTSSFPPKEKLIRILDYFENTEYPLLIHCRAGADRTGFASALYRHVMLDEPIEEAKKSLSMRHGHLLYQTLDFLIDQYQKEDGKDFRRWIENDYDRGRLKYLHAQD